MKTQFFKPKTPQKITDLSWKQAKEKYPLMKPYGDADKDGLKNFRDCKPFDFKRKGEKHEEEDGESKRADEAWEKLSSRKKALAEEGLLDEW